MPSTARFVSSHGPRINRADRLTQFTDPVHIFFTLDSVKVDDPRFVHLPLRGIVMIGWFVLYIRMLTRWAFQAMAAACALMDFSPCVSRALTSNLFLAFTSAHKSSQAWHGDTRIYAFISSTIVLACPRNSVATIANCRLMLAWDAL